MTRSVGFSRFWLGVILTSVILASMTIGSIVYIQFREETVRTQAVETLKDTAEDVASELETNFVRMDQIARLVAAMVADNQSLEAVETILLQTLASTTPEQIYGIGVFFAPYIFQNHANFAPYANRVIYNQADSVINYYWSEPSAENNFIDYHDSYYYKLGANNRGAVQFSVPYLDSGIIWQSASFGFETANGLFGGIVLVDMVFPQLDDFIQRVNTDSTRTIYLTTPGYYLIAHPQLIKITGLATQSGINASNPLSIPSSVVQDYNKKLYPDGCIAVEHTVNYVGWLVNICQDSAVIFQPLRSLSNSLYVSIGSLWVVAVIGVIFFYRLLQRSNLLYNERHSLRSEIARQHEIQTILEERVKARTLDLEKAVEEAHLASKAKSTFLANVSHELRTPLNAILNYTDFILLGMMGTITVEQRNALENVSTSGKHLLALINDVLDMTKIETGNLKLFIEDNIDLTEEVQTAMTLAETLLKTKAVQLSANVEPDLPLIVGDRRRIRQILINLLSNAIKFTEKGSITLLVKRQNDEVLISVADTGSGISDKDSTLIFEPFKQAESNNRHGDGTGLGLPISRRFAEAHGGRLWVQSELDKGSTFFVRLPIRSEKLLDQLRSEVQYA